LEKAERIWQTCLKRASGWPLEPAVTARLYELSTWLTATADLPSILYQVLDATIELQGADFGNIQLFDSATRTLKIVAHRGFNQEFLDYFASVDAGDRSACGLALRSGARIIIEDVNTNAEFAVHRGIAAAAGFRGVQSTPLLDRNSGQSIGMLSTHFREPYRPAENELQLTDFYARGG
jgi:two-component system, chemotaxis family, CheB/CheR fusion protein